MPHGTDFERTNHPPPIPTWTEYLRRHDPKDRRFCHAIANPNAQPWLTLVLGSGCATTKPQVAALYGLVDLLADETAKIESLPRYVETRPLAAIVKSFSADLVRDRMRQQAPPSYPEVRYPVNDWLIHVLAAAALLTRLFFRIKATRYVAPCRAHHENTAVLTKDKALWPVLHGEYLPTCDEIVKTLLGRAQEMATSLAAEASTVELGTTVKDLFSQVRDSLAPRAHGTIEVPWETVQSMSEFAWLCLTSAVRDVNVYPGWSDLLLDLSNYDLPAGAPVGIPSFEVLTGANSLIYNRYQRVTRASWEDSEASNTKLYAAAAHLLNAQYAYRQRKRLQPQQTGHVDSPPAVTAFVTSFELELELALLREGHPFTVAIPVHVLNMDHKIAHTYWIAFDVPADDQRIDRLDRLLSPNNETWRVLEDHFRDEGPIIIHLAGCPLIRLPEWEEVRTNLEGPLQSQLASIPERMGNWAPAADSKLQLQHAIVLNEHAAMLQTTIDLVRPASGSLGLPGNFVSVDKAGIKYFRFWTLLGVQLRDSAIRQRIATLISILPIYEATPQYEGVSLPGDDPLSISARGPGEATDRQSPDRTHRVGVAVNMHSSTLEQDLLTWDGFDVVRSDVSEVLSDLEHYTIHLAEEDLCCTGAGDCKAAARPTLVRHGDSHGNDA